MTYFRDRDIKKFGLDDVQKLKEADELIRDFTRFALFRAKEWCTIHSNDASYPEKSMFERNLGRSVSIESIFDALKDSTQNVTFTYVSEDQEHGRFTVPRSFLLEEDTDDEIAYKNYLELKNRFGK